LPQMLIFEIMLMQASVGVSAGHPRCPGEQWMVNP
jgi:hypothetical protein